jgi:hypothetical protein
MGFFQQGKLDHSSIVFLLCWDYHHALALEALEKIK